MIQKFQDELKRIDDHIDEQKALVERMKKYKDCDVKQVIIHESIGMIRGLEMAKESLKRIKKHYEAEPIGPIIGDSLLNPAIKIDFKPPKMTYMDEMVENINKDFDDRVINHLDTIMAKRFGTYKGTLKWKLTGDWFNMTNDDFFKKYGFNYVPDNNIKNKYLEVEKIKKKDVKNVSSEMGTIIQNIGEGIRDNMKNALGVGSFNGKV